jgi:molybdopterin molybdotransferase
MTPEMLSVENALDKILAMIEPGGIERLPLENVCGRVLAEVIQAPHHLPPFSSSSMDGFAVRAADVKSVEDGPVTLPVSGDVPAAQHTPPPLKPGTAVRIMTGAPVPEGSDLIVPVEATSRPEAMAGQDLSTQVTIHQAGESGDYIRPAGLDLKTGQTVMKVGQFMGASEIGLLAALGIQKVDVFNQPLVAVLSTGDELLPVDAALKPGAIRDANSYSLAASVERVGGRARRIGIVPDDEDVYRTALDEAVEAGVSLLISSGGVSMGAYDVVRTVLEQDGDVSFWRVNLRPGKPILFGHYRDIPFFGLPGNPVSALVTFEIFCAPVIARLQGEPAHRRAQLVVKAAHEIRTDGRESYFRAVVCWDGDQPWASLTGNQDSSLITSMLQANALLIVPADMTEIQRGQTLTAWLLDGKVLSC